MNGEKMMLVGQAMSGLLASGHFTFYDNEEGCDVLSSIDAGKEWREEGIFARRHPSDVVLTALDLVDELVEQIKLREEDEEGPEASQLAAILEQPSSANAPSKTRTRKR